MAKEHIVDYRDEGSGKALKLDLENGFLYDDKGNQVGKWEPTNNDHSTLLADYVEDLATQSLLYSLSTADPDRAQQALLRARERAHLMDLGPSDVHQASPMSNFASGYRNEPPMADMFAPPLLTEKPSAKYYQYDRNDAFQRALPVVGAGGAGVPEISPRLANTSFSTTERASGGYVSTQTEAAQDAPLRIRQATARRVMTALMIEREIRVATLATTTGSWATGLHTTLGAGYQWNGGASADPVKDIHERMEASWGGVTGMIMSQPLFHAFVRNPAVRAYYAYKDSAAAAPDPTQLSALLRIPQIFVAKMQYINTSGVKAYIWGNDVTLVRQPDEMPPASQDDVMTACTFRWNAVDVRDGAAAGGFIVREFFVQDRGSMGGNKIVIVHQDAEVMTSAYVGGLIKAAYQ